MPNRILRDWTDSDRVNAVSANAERLFVRLIMKADDYGCFYADPRMVKAYLFPLLDVRIPDITRWLDELETAGLVATYDAEGRRFIEVTNFGQRMRNSRRRFPAPPASGGDSRRFAASCGELRPETETGGGRRETSAAVTPRSVIHTARPAADDRGENSSSAGKKFPTTIAEVLAVAERAGAICTKEQAEKYLLSRQASGWLLGNGLPVHDVGSDVKRFVMTWQQHVADDAKRHGGGATAERSGGMTEAEAEALRRRNAELEREAEQWK